MSDNRTVEERFWVKVDQTGTCWLWLASKTGHGYGSFQGEAKRTVRAHRFAYELLVGPIPDGKELDHLCRVRHCVNPDHLEPVTGSVNTLRGHRGAYCPNGHERTTGTTRMKYQPNKGRWCRVCLPCREARYARRRVAS